MDCVTAQLRCGSVVRVLKGGADRGSRPQVAGLTPGGVAQRSDAVCVGDRIRAVNGTSADGLLHHEVLDLLRDPEPRVQLELEYDMPESVVSSDNVCACPRVIQVTLEKEQGSFGFTVRGGTCADDPARSRPLTVTHVRPGGPTDREGTVKAGDRLLAVDGHRLTHATLSEAHHVLTSVQRQAVLTVEYDVSVMDGVRAGPGPLLVEVERPAGSGLGLTLGSAGSAVVIESIRQASIAERVGALQVGDQVLAIDDLSLEELSVAEASRLLQSCNSSVLRLEIVPVANRRPTDAKRCKATLPASLQATSSALSTSSCGSGSYNTLGSVCRRRQAGRTTTRKHRGHGDGSSAAGTTSKPETGSVSSGGQYSGVGPTLCHQETTCLTLQADSHGFGLGLGGSRSSQEDSPPAIIKHIEPGSPADKCGILQVGDRVIEINHRCTEELTPSEVTRLIADSLPRVTLAIEFDVADAVVPSSGTFLVKLVKRGPSLGLTVSAPKSRQLGEPLIVSDVERGSVTHRNGTIEPGDRLLSIDGVSVDRQTIQEAAERLQMCGEIVTLRVQKDNLWTDVPDSSRVVFTVELERHGGPLGLTISGTEEPFDPIFISGLTEGGLAERTGALHISDRVLAINGYSLRGKPLSEAIHMLQNSGDLVRLKVAKASAIRRGTYSGGGGPSVDGLTCRQLSSALPSVDSAVESWDSGGPAEQLCRLRLTGSRSGSAAGSVDGNKHNNGSLGERDSAGTSGAPGERWDSSSQQLAAGGRPHSSQAGLEEDTEGEDDWNKMLSDLEEVGESFRRDLEHQRNAREEGSLLCSRAGAVGSSSARRPPRQPNWQLERCSAATAGHQSDPELAGALRTNSAPEFHQPGSYASHPQLHIHRVTLFKDAVYEDFGFSLSNALYEKGVYVNRIKPGGPADRSGILRPHDRILKVNDTVTADFDCCHIVPLIASVGDRLELLVARSPYADQQPQLEDEADVRPWVEDDDNEMESSPEPAGAAGIVQHVL